MPPKKKRPGKNGFWQFALEIRAKNSNRNLNWQEVQDYAGRKWANMSKEERKPYEELAQVARNNYTTGRFTTDGYEIEALEKQAKDAEENLREMKNSILSDLKACSLAGTLADQIFLIIHINHLIYYPSEDKYFICEIGVSSFSLKNGIEDIFHKIVKPGKLPLGFYGGALTHSKETHQLIEIVQEEPYEDDTQEVFNDLIQFMKRFSVNRKIPILYTEEKTLEMTKKVFENFQQQFNFNDEIKIYNLQYLFFALRNAAAGKNVWHSETFSYNEIEKDIYSYCPNISCDYHEVSDISVYCSKSIVTRYAYIICDNCCFDLGIQLVPGNHVPEKSRIQGQIDTCIKFESNSSSVASLNEITANPWGGSLSSQDYEHNYPPLGSGKSSASSLISFSSMKTPVRGNVPSTSRNVTAWDSVNKVSLNPLKRIDRNLKLPEHGYKRGN